MGWRYVLTKTNLIKKTANVKKLIVINAVSVVGKLTSPSKSPKLRRTRCDLSSSSGHKALIRSSKNKF